MNSIRCPGCGAVNALSATECRQCRANFGELPRTAYVSVSPEEIYQAQYPGSQTAPADNESGRKTFFWYRVYCGVMVALYLLTTAFGVFLAVAAPETRQYSPGELFIMGVVYASMGGVLALVFAVALLLPRRRWNWIVGIVMIALGMTSCCFAPFLIPLLIYWLKPETKSFFGRN